MILWMILTILCSAAAVLVAAPFLRSYGASGTAANADLQVYRDQLDEVEREARSGMIDAAQAEGARSEISRRLLLADRRPGASPMAQSLAGNQTAVVGIAGIVVLGSVVLYALSGRPDLPSSSASPRQPAIVQAAPVAPRGAPPSQADGRQPLGAAAAAPGLGSVDEMIERIAARLKQNPGNAEDWRMLGWSYFGTERYQQAAEAYAKAASLQPKDASLHASRGEALVRAAQGAISADVKAVFETTLKLDPTEPRARFFLGLAKEQAGDKAGALADWTALAKDADPAEPWLGDLQQRIGELAGRLGVAAPAFARAPAASSAASPAASNDAAIPGLKLLKEAEPAAGSSPPVASSAGSSAERGPTAADVKAAESLSAGDRNAMIRGMVDGLAARLEKSPRDADGWIKLIRSRKVLGEDAAASVALKRALDIFADAPDERAQIVAAAMQLQVKP